MATETFGSVTIISDVGATANSYISVADAKAYYDLDPYKSYSEISDETIAKSLITATRLTDYYFGSKYKGELQDSDNALFWPRTGVNDERGILIQDFTVFPEQLGLAIAEQGYAITQSDREAESTIGTTISQTLEGVGSKTYMSASDQRIANAKSLFVERFNQLIAPFVIGGVSRYTSVLVRG